MEMILDEKDVSDWIYRGEGNANLVLAYTGSSPLFVGKVMRIQKARKNDKTNKSMNGTAVLTSDEQLLWRDYKELISSPSKEVLEQRFVKNVMSPLLGPKYVDAGMRICVSKEFLESVDKKVTKQRPLWRVNTANVDTSHDSVLLMSDHSLFSHDTTSGSDCISVEIKVSELSEYDPLDLYSGSKERIRRAVKALYSTPQNNFRVFLNGALLFGGSGGSIGRTTTEYGDTFEDALRGFIQTDDGLRTKCFIELVCEAVYSSRVLDRLLEVQKLDTLDIEGAIHSYYNVISQPCPVCKESEEDGASLPPLQYTSLHSLPLDESVKIVKDYLIAATAKDCSVMISFKSRESVDSAERSCNNVYLESTNQAFGYKVHFIDLSPKPLKKVEAYYEIDKRIVSFYTETMKGEIETGGSKPLEK